MVLDCGCDICSTYHQHRKVVIKRRRLLRDEAREQSPDRRAYKAARSGAWYVEHKKKGKKGE